MSPTAGDDSLFVYGSLLFPEVLQALLDRVPSRTPAAAPSWRVAALPARDYPGLVPGPGSASGLLLAELTPEEWRTLIAFEGELYDLRRLTLSGGQSAQAFIWGGGSPASAQDWVPEDFAERILPSYVEGCLAWRRRYEASEAAPPPAGRQ
jgi:gamma-glutamylcyclotransferase (GGCT)/AIG2-like uncharacterized protein YtfP